MTDSGGARREFLSTCTLYAVGHFHLDPLWLWDKSDGLERFRSTVRSALNLMDRNPELCVAASSAALYAYLQRVDPDLFERLAARVQEGRWEPVGGMWVEPDEHVPSGESYIRQLLLGQEFFQRAFGRIARIAWSPDSFGRYGQLPRMLAGAGLDYFVFKRPERSQRDLPDLFWWMADDGSRVLTYHLHEYLTWDSSLPRLQERIARDLRAPYRTGLLLFGVGNHGGGPTQANIDEIHRLQRDPAQPEIRFGTTQEFFARLEADGLDGKIPIVHDHLDYFEAGGYASHARLKYDFRLTERLLGAAETFAAVRATSVPESYPHAALTRAWQQLAFNQFHDTAAGTCIPDVYPAVLDEMAEARSLSRDVLLDSLHALAGEIDIPFIEGAQPLVLFNPCGHAVRQFVTAHVQLAPLPPDLGDPTATHRLVDHEGYEIPTQRIVATAMPANRVGFVIDLPPLGYRALQLVPRMPDECSPTLDDLPTVVNTLANEYLQVELDPDSGSIRTLRALEAGLEVFAAPGAVPLVVADEGNAWGPSRYDLPRPGYTWHLDSIRRTQHGPLLSALAARSMLFLDGVPTGTILEQEFRLARGLPWVDVTVRLDWREHGSALKLAFPVFIKNYPEATVETPYATVRYALDGREVPGLAWADVTGESDFIAPGVRLWHGVTIATSAKYSYAFTRQPGNRAIIWLLAARGNAYTFTAAADVERGVDVAYEDEGRQEFSYRIVPHLGSWWEAGSDHMAGDLNRPLVVVTESSPSGTRPPEASLFDVSVPNIRLGAVKQAEAGGTSIVRLYEAYGEETTGVRICCLGAIWQADFKPREIKSFLLSAGRVTEVDLLECPLQRDT